MSATSAPFGFRPVRNARTARPYTISAAYGTALYKYMPVALVTAGTIQTAVVGSDVIGVLAGVEYTDSQNRRVVSTYWPGAVTGATDIVAWVWDDPCIEYLVQGDGSMAQAVLGAQSDVTNLTNNANGLSTCTLDSTPEAAAAQGMFRIIEIEKAPDNEPGDAYTRCIVEIAQHAYRADKAGI